MIEAFVAWVGLTPVIITAGLISFFVIMTITLWCFRQEVREAYGNFLLIIFLSLIFSVFSSMIWPILVILGLAVSASYGIWHYLLRERNTA